MAQEPYTVILNSGKPMGGSTPIPLTRNDLPTTPNNQRVYTAQVPSGNQITSELFGLFSPGAVLLVTIHASSSNPTDRVVHAAGNATREELSLSEPVQVLLAPSETLSFITSAATTIAIVANALSDAQHAALRQEERTTRYRLRFSKTDGAGFTPLGGVSSPQPTWSTSTRRFDAVVGGGAIALESLVPGERRFDGVSVRVRLTGFSADTAAVGVSSSASGEAFLATVPRGAWSPWLPMSHDDALALQTDSPPATAPVVHADVEVEWSRTLASECCHGSASLSADEGESTPVGGAIPFGAWSDYSVNAAGARLSDEGWTLFTHGITGNQPGGFGAAQAGNKVVFGTDFGLVDQPITALQNLSIRYADRRPAETSILANPYVNFVVDINGDGSEYKILVLDQYDTNAALNLLTKASVAGTVPEDHEYTLTWVGGGRVKVVGPNADPLPGVTPVEDEGNGSWLLKVYTLTDIIAVFPNAKFAHAFPDDPGLPNGVCLPTTLLVLGDSGWTRYASVLVRRVTLNA